MKYCVIFGSPRKSGNTASLLKIVTDKLMQNGHSVVRYDAYDMMISGCRACLGCQKDKSTICCVINDDMQQILRTVSESDVLLIAAPIYLWSVPAPVKAVLDRLVYSGCKYYEDDPKGPSLFAGKKAALISTCGYPPEKAADLLTEALKRYCRHTKMIYVGTLCERQRNLKEPFMDAFKAAHAERFAEILMAEN